MIHAVGEPVRSFDLTPSDYAWFVEQLWVAGVPLAGITFQGYEVTLPASWPYLEAVFTLAARWRIRRSFITNGMLLSKWSARVVALDPQRVTVSLDGADAAANDARRGVEGAFDATLTSLRRFLREAPDYRARVAIASTMYDQTNVRSLRKMPALLEELGIARWALSFELALVNGRERPVQPRDVVARWAEELVAAAERRGIRVHLNDEFSFFGNGPRSPAIIRAKHVFDVDHIVRFEPGGFVRVGREITEAFDPARSRRWCPRTGDAAVTIGYWRQMAGTSTVQNSSTRPSGSAPTPS